MSLSATCVHALGFFINLRFAVITVCPHVSFQFHALKKTREAELRSKEIQDMAFRCL